MIALPTKHRILIVDDEPDIATVTQLSLRGLRYREHPVEFVTATTGVEALAAMRARPDTSVILLDVVMETATAGLNTCRAIREELGNHFVRILLRTGQPGIAPEKKTIDEYDIDGYLPKAELTTNRLYVAVRTALKAYEELVELERHRYVFTFLHNAVAALHTFEPLEATLQRILTTAVAIAPSPFAVLDLETFEDQGNPRHLLLHLAANADPVQAQSAAAALAARVAADRTAHAPRNAGPFNGGFLVPMTLHRELGYGWIYLEGVAVDTLISQALSLLAAHAANALYASVAQAMLAAREGPFYDSLIV